MKGGYADWTEQNRRASKFLQRPPGAHFSRLGFLPAAANSDAIHFGLMFR